MIVQNSFGQSLSLMPHQVDDYTKQRNRILNSMFVGDTSVTGAGKTYIIKALCVEFLLCPYVVCPKTAESNWIDELKRDGIQYMNIVSYDSFRGIAEISKKNALARDHGDAYNVHTGQNPKHGLLNRHDIYTKNSEGVLVHTLHYEPTPLLLELLAKGVTVQMQNGQVVQMPVFFVFDEAHKLKNDSAQSRAVEALTTTAVRLGSLSRFAILSGTLFDKMEHTLRLFRVMGILTKRNLYTAPRGKPLVLEGMQEIIDHCNSIDRHLTEGVLSEYRFEKKNMHEIAFRFFVQVVKPRYFSAMIPSSKCHVFTYYLALTPEQHYQLQMANRELATSARYNAVTKQADRKKADWSGITAALTRIQDILTQPLIADARRELLANPKRKVLIMSKFRGTKEGDRYIRAFTEGLKEFNPIQFTGSVTKTHRKELVDTFNRDPTRRVFNSITSIGGTSINLDDQTPDGSEPRLIYLLPDYDITLLHQAKGRIDRSKTTSWGEARLVQGYLNGTDQMVEIDSIIRALSEKSDIWKYVLEEQAKAGVIFPGYYPRKLAPSI
jgi:hypothetical protein